MQNHPFRRRTVALAVSFLSAVVVVSADDRLQSSAKGGTIAVTFRALSDDGQPVLDLKPADVSLKVGGKSRELRSLQLVQIGNKAAASAAPAASLPAPFATNVASAGAGREVYLVVDDESIMRGTEQSLKDAITQLVESLSPQDRVALLSTPRNTLSVSPTGEFDAVRSTIRGFTGRAEASVIERDFACRTQMTLQWLKSFFGSLSSGSAATVVFFSAGLTSPTGDSSAPIGFTSDTCLIQTKNYQDVAASVIPSRANFYVVHVMESVVTIVPTEESNPSTGARRRNQGTGTATNIAAGVEGLAGTTGGELIRLSGRSEASMARVARETSAYYVASFEPEPSERTGTNAKIELRAVRDGVKVKAPPEVTIAKATSPSPRDMLRTGAVFRDLPLRALGYSVRNPGDDKLKIIALFEPTEPSVTITSAAVGLVEVKTQKLTGQWTADASDLSRTPLLAGLLASAGTYRMRVAAVDSSGRAGTVDYELRAEMTNAAPVRLGALALGAVQNNAFVPKVQFSPTDPAVIGYLEIYGAPKGATVAVNLEIASSETGPPMGSTPAQVQGADDFRAAVGGFPLDTLPPGDYLLRAIVSVDGKEVGRLTRTLRKAAP